MEPCPSKVSEALVGWLVPPACREEILGDMRQRHQRAAPYLLEASYVIPCVIYSRICRTTDAVVALIEVLSMYTVFVISAWSLDGPMLFEKSGFARLAIPPALCLAAVILTDAYSSPQKRWPLKPLLAPTVGCVLAYLVQCTRNQWSLRPAVFSCGIALSFLLVATLRLTFSPVTDRPQASRSPAFWQKLELAPFALDPKSALLSCGIVLAVILYLLGK
jgi:hypothetical protein